METVQKNIKTCWATVIIVLISTGDLLVAKDLCDGWKLVGGGKPYEGVLQVVYNNKTVNMCDSEDVAVEVCKHVVNWTKDTKLRKFDGNVFEVPLEKSSIDLGDCDNQTAKFTQCPVASLCCYDIDDRLKQCSDSWYKTVQTSTGAYHRLVSASMARWVKYPNDSNHWNFPLSWTASALKLIQHANNLSDPDNEALRTCTQKCFDKKDLEYIAVDSINESDSCRCFMQGEALSDGTAVFQIVEKTEETDLFACLAAEVKNGNISISTQNCSKYLPWFVIPEDMLPTTTRPTTISTTPHYDIHKEDRPGTTIAPYSDPDRADDIVLGIIVPTVLVVLVVAVCIVVVLACRRREKRQDQQRPNSLVNRIYGVGVVRETDDEEYALIDTVTQLTELPVHRPPLPERNTNIITLDEYSSPCDMVKEEFQFDPASEYSTTYDDPVRHPEKWDNINTECEDPVRHPEKWENINTQCESRTKQGYCNEMVVVINKHICSKDGLDRKNSADWKTGDFGMQNQEDGVCLDINKKDDGEELTITQTTGTETKDELNECAEHSVSSVSKSDTDILNEEENSYYILEHSAKTSRPSTISACVTTNSVCTEQFKHTDSDTPSELDDTRRTVADACSEYEDTYLIDRNFPPKRKVAQSGDSIDYEDTDIITGNFPPNRRAALSGDSIDYEDTDIIDGNFPPKGKAALSGDSSDYEDTDTVQGRTSVKCVFPQHVCLDCLTPEHLKILGISVITDDTYSLHHRDLEPTLSEPLRRSYCDGLETVELGHGAEGGLSCGQTERKCSVCKNIYDTLGRVKREQWEKATDHVYDRFCKVEHTRRGMLLKKRLKSS